MQDYRIFLSSFSREFVEDQVGENKDDPLWNLRWQIYEEGGGSVYVADHDERDSGSLALLAKHDPLAATDVLIERSMQSSEMVVILGGNRRGRDEHGKLIEVNKRISQVSHFEIELFHAAFTRKPVYFFILEGFDPGPRLAALLKLIEPAFPHLNLEIRNSPEKILSEIRRIREGPVSTIAAANGDLFQSLLYASRNEGGANPVLFLDGAVEVRSDGPDETLVQELLKESSSLPEMHRKLSRQWIAAREMMAVDYRSSAITVDHLKLWNSVLSSWSGSAAWSGLFAPVFGGVFAAINSIDIVRKKLALSSRSDIPEEARLRPFGAYASAYYSRAKKSPFHDHKFYLKRALEYCNKVIPTQNITMFPIFRVSLISSGHYPAGCTHQILNLSS